MATVVNVQEIAKRFVTLGWDNLPVSDVVEWIAANGVPAAALIAYLNAAVSSPAGFDDQSIASCPPATANKITAALKNKGCEAT